MKISFFTLGCKLNQAETDELKKTLCKQKFLIVPFGTNEDIAVVRACGVTCGASQTTREMVRRAKRVGSKVVVIGCLENIDLPEIDFIAKNNEEVIRYILEELKNKKIDKNIAPSLKITNKNDGNDRTRALIKIQTGCNFKHLPIPLSKNGFNRFVKINFRKNKNTPHQIRFPRSTFDIK